VSHRLFRNGDYFFPGVIGDHSLPVFMITRVRSRKVSYKAFGWMGDAKKDRTCNTDTFEFLRMLLRDNYEREVVYLGPSGDHRCYRAPVLAE